MTPVPRLVALLAVPLLALTACGGDDTAGGTTAAAEDALDVVTSFYPLQYVTEQVAGDRARVQNLTKPGAEPHDLELTPQDVGAVSDADLVVVLHGFQPAVDEAVANQAGDRVLDVEEAARLDLTAEDSHAEEGHAEEGHAEEGHAEEGHAEEGHTEEGHTEEGHDHGGVDPHFWLDPTRLADVADAVADRLAQADPDGRADFEANAAALRTELEALDAEFAAGLRTCANRTLVTSHEAFGYLAERYDLTQMGVVGLSPDADPDAATLARVADFVRDNEVTTIYTETLVSAAVAETVAAETGARTAVLDPIEGLSDASAADDYPGVMRANLEALKAGQSCS